MLDVSEPVPRVLEDLERTPAQYVLSGVKRHLASLGIHGLAEQLRWEAYLSLATTQDFSGSGTVVGDSLDGLGAQSGSAPSTPSSNLLTDEVQEPNTFSPSKNRTAPRRHDNDNDDDDFVCPAPPRKFTNVRILAPSIPTQSRSLCTNSADVQPIAMQPCEPRDVSSTVMIPQAEASAALWHDRPAKRMAPASEACAVLRPHAKRAAVFSTAGPVAGKAHGLSTATEASCQPQQAPSSNGLGAVAIPDGVPPPPLPASFLHKWLAYRPPPSPFRGVPLSHCVPGGKFVVDQFSKAAQSSGVKHFFLTHFHYDHYGGLTKHFKAGCVYCTAETARLVQHKLKVAPARIKEVPFRQPFKVLGHLVTFLPANHCPGAAMVVFERPGAAPVLHCGDCRYDRARFQAVAELAALRGRVTLHLDTTYCAPQHCFPLQREVVAEVVRVCRGAAARASAAGRAPPLFVFGSYTIGKERLFLEVAVHLGLKVFLEKDKWQVLQCIDMRVCERRLLTRNVNEAAIHVVPMRQIRMDRLAAQLKAHGGFASLLAFKPTGWTFSPCSGGGAAGSTAHAPAGWDAKQRQLCLPAARHSGVADAAGGEVARGCVAGAGPEDGIDADAEAVGGTGNGGSAGDGDGEFVYDACEVSSDDCELVGPPGGTSCAALLPQDATSGPGAGAECTGITGGMGGGRGGGHARAAAVRSAHDVLMCAQRGRPARGTAPSAAAAAAPLGQPENVFQHMMRAAEKKTQRSAGDHPGVGGVERQACAPWVRFRSSGAVRVLDVPYSEHSSCSELREFVAWLRPHAVIPTVGGGRDATPRMLRTIAGVAESPQAGPS